MFNILFMLKKTVQFIETLKKGDIVGRDVKQERSFFHHYKISNFAVAHSQKNPTDDALTRTCTYECLRLASEQVSSSFRENRAGLGPANILDFGLNGAFYFARLRYENFQIF